MPRIRTIKPEFWTDGNIIALSPFARLLYIGSWNFALCDRGHLAEDHLRLKLQVLPADDVDIKALVQELLDLKRFDLIEAHDGRRYWHVKRMPDHQKIEKRWASRCPACLSLGLDQPPATSPNLSEPPASSPNLAQTRPTSAQEGKGREGKKNPHRASFEEWWAAYPRKVGKADAERKYEIALKRATPEVLLVALNRFASLNQSADPRFIPHPATWLHQGRWEDADPAATTPSRLSTSGGGW
jgi:hypothetical protein